MVRDLVCVAFSGALPALLNFCLPAELVPVRPRTQPVLVEAPALALRRAAAGGPAGST